MTCALRLTSQVAVTSSFQLYRGCKTDKRHTSTHLPQHTLTTAAAAAAAAV
jgi:hypothetical protein